jgi:hypothetical protein
MGFRSFFALLARNYVCCIISLSAFRQARGVIIKSKTFGANSLEARHFGRMAPNRVDVRRRRRGQVPLVKQV